LKISKYKAVNVHYSLSNNEGEVLDSSEGGEPLSFIHGIGALLPSLERSLEGKPVGEKIIISIEPEDAYGLRDESLVHTVTRDAFSGVDKLEVGMCFQSSGGQEPEGIIISRINGDQITVDSNHPLAGVVLNFDIDILSVRDATEEELKHGHIHGPDGHKH